MESGIQSSFIPKDAGKVAVAPRQPGGGGLGDLVLLIAIVLVVVSCALAGAVFLYDQYLQSSVATKLAQLERAKESLEPALIKKLTRLDDRMLAAEHVLSTHIAPTAFFLALAQVTLVNVSFSSIELDATDAKKITIKMPGVAKSVNSIALQADLMSKNGFFVSPIFSDISRQLDGVHFGLLAELNPAAINYATLVRGAVQQLTAQQQGAQQPTTQQAQPSLGQQAASSSAPTQGGAPSAVPNTTPVPQTLPTPQTLD